jgi:hypothetical protein
MQKNPKVKEKKLKNVIEQCPSNDDTRKRKQTGHKEAETNRTRRT